MKINEFKTLRAGDRITVHVFNDAPGGTPPAVATVTGAPFDGGTMIPVLFDVAPSNKPHERYARVFSVYFRDVVARGVTR